MKSLKKIQGPKMGLFIGSKGIDPSILESNFDMSRAECVTERTMGQSVTQII